MTFLPHIASRVVGVPLMVERGRLETILSVLGPRIGVDATVLNLGQQQQGPNPGTTPGPNPPGQKPVAPNNTQQMEPDDEDDETQAYPPDHDRDRDYIVTQDGIALIPIIGTLVKRVMGVDAMSGLSNRSSYGTLENMILDASTDSSVNAILLEIDSPGGEVGGVFDLADMIKQARQIKPVWAVADDALSAAYLIAAAAERIYTTQTSAVGSIGVIAVHVDESGMDAKVGMKYTAIIAGARKNDFSPHEPLSKDAQETIQTEVDRVYSMFCQAVAVNRGLTVEAVQATQAGIFFGSNAVSAGLANRIGNLRTALADLSATIAATDPNQAPSDSNRPTGTQSQYSPAPYDNTDDNEEAIPMVQNQTKTPVSAQGQAQPKAEPPQNAKVDAKKKKNKGRGDGCTTPAEPFVTKAQAKEITGMCALAGYSHLAGDFIVKGMKPEQVSKKLLALKAHDGGEEILGQVHAHTGTNAAQYFDPETNPVVAACRRITGTKAKA